MISRRGVLRGTLVCSLAITAGCGGADRRQETEPPSEHERSGETTGDRSDTSSDGDASTGGETPRTAGQPTYISDLSVTHRAEGNLSVRIRAIESVPDSGDGTPEFGAVVYDETLSDPPETIDLSEYREDGIFELVLDLDGEEILRETLHPYESLDVTVRSGTDIETDWVLE